MNSRLRTLMLGTAAAALLIAGGTYATFAQAPGQSPVAASPAQDPDSLALKKVYDSLPAAAKTVFRFMSPENRQIALQEMLIHRTIGQQPTTEAELVKVLTPKAKAALDKLSPADRAAAVKDLLAGLPKFMGNPQVGQQLIQVRPSRLEDAVKQLRSGFVYVRADKPYNYCNVMLDSEGEMAYDEDGVKKLAATPRACPIAPTGTQRQQMIDQHVNVDHLTREQAEKKVAADTLAVTIEYVNKLLAWTIQDPNYTRVQEPAELADMQKGMSGTQTAFKGGGIGLELPIDQTKTVPLTGDELVNWTKGKAAFEASLKTPPLDECTGQPRTLVAAQLDQRDGMQKFFARGPIKTVFTGLVGHVVSTGPGAKADVHTGDIITKVDGQNVIGLDNDEVVNNKLRGKLGTDVTLTIMRDGQELTKTLTRAEIVPDPVYAVDLGDGIYSIVIPNFEVANVSFKMLDLMQKLEPKAKGWIFDVRNNPGGQLDEGIQAVLWLIHDGTIFSQRERVLGDPANPQYNKITWTRVGSKAYEKVVDDKSGKVLGDGEADFYEGDPKTGAHLRDFKDQPFLLDSGKPAVVLANGHSASAAEIFTGGVSENCIGDDHCVDAQGKKATGKPQGAVFIGETTYGKFIGQTIKPGPEGVGLKGTTFRYYGPDGKWGGDAWKVKIGITPQIEVKQPEFAMPYTASDVQLNFAKQYLVSGGTATPPVGK